jgi:hypothetical protein
MAKRNKPSNRARTRAIRERMAATGESYTVASRRVQENRRKRPTPFVDLTAFSAAVTSMAQVGVAVTSMAQVGVAARAMADSPAVQAAKMMADSPAVQMAKMMADSPAVQMAKMMADSPR